MVETLHRKDFPLGLVSGSVYDFDTKWHLAYVYLNHVCVGDSCGSLPFRLIKRILI